MSRRASGVLLILASAVAFGSLALFARKAFDSGVGHSTLLMLRFGLAALTLGMVALVRRAPLARGRSLYGLLLMGGLYVGQSYCFFAALKHAPTSLVSLMLYLYPGIVTVLAVAFLGERITWVKGVALALAISGSILTVGPVGAATAPGILFGVGTALFYSCYLLCGTRVLPGLDSMSAAFVVIATAAVFYTGLSLAHGVELPQATVGWLWVGLLALVSTVVSITALLAGLERVGPVNASTLSAVEPVGTALLGVWFLGEKLVTIQILGGIMILSAVVVLSRDRSSA